jgi:thiamine-monophosphate kinase
VNLKDIGEFGFIERISAGCLIRPEGVVQAIGDDAAATVPPAGEVLLVTCDLLVERVHFLRDAVSGVDLGHKALAVNLSDIAAMGGTARDAYVSIAIPESCGMEYLEAIYRGMKTLAAEFAVNILGGDTTSSARDLVLAITVTGSAPADRILRRSGAKPGDAIGVTGVLGDSRAGLRQILDGRLPATPAENALYQAHVRPRPHLAEGRWLAGTGAVHAAIDVSDGLSSDIGHISRASGVGIRLEASRIPVSDALIDHCRQRGLDPLAQALAGGEDYVLLFCAAPDAIDRLAKAFADEFGRPFTIIGHTTATAGRMEIRDPDGRVRPFAARGWDHFRRQP